MAHLNQCLKERKTKKCRIWKAESKKENTEKFRGKQNK